MPGPYQLEFEQDTDITIEQFAITAALLGAAAVAAVVGVAAVVARAVRG